MKDNQNKTYLSDKPLFIKAMFFGLVGVGIYLFLKAGRKKEGMTWSKFD